MFKDHNRRKMGSRMELNWLSNSEELEETGFGSTSLERKAVRTYLMVLDHKQFLAARRIQSAWQGYALRKELERRRCAVITIQRWWRGHKVRLSIMRLIEHKLQKTMEQLYNHSATVIQSLFRGWHIRQTVHNMNSLRHIQLCAAEELLSCVAYKLHHLLRTYSLPGVYSLRNSNCLSKVEEVLATMSYRFHNSRVTYYHARQECLSRAHREHFDQSKYYTTLPFSGPNFNSVCKPQCVDNFFASKNLDRRMYDIIAEVERTLTDPTMHKTRQDLVNRKVREHVEQVLNNRNRKQRDFCGDVIESMRKWKLWDGQKISFGDDLSSNPESLKGFLEEAARLMDKYSQDCHCTITKHDVDVCH